MRSTIVIAAHNEGALLSKTIESTIDSLANLDYNIVVADDASTDDSIDLALQRFPWLEVTRHTQRQGTSPTKALGARKASGEVLVFLDGHTKPEGNAIAKLVQDVQALDGEAIVTPAIADLNTQHWINNLNQVGHGYSMDMEMFDTQWRDVDELRVAKVGRMTFYESPALIGCAFAVSRLLYNRLWGFDAHMRSWGVEDLDLGLKCWPMGHRILHDPQAVVGHRFRDAFDTCVVPVDHVLVNQIRMARKNLTGSVWAYWIDRCRQRSPERLTEHPEGLWAHAWELFLEDRPSAEQERAYLQARRVRDEFWYAERFGLSWPRLQSLSAAATGPLLADMALAPSVAPSPKPSPKPGQAKLVIDSPAPNTTFAITDAPAMPQIVARARVTGITPDPTPTTQFKWTVQIRYNARTCSHGPQRSINPPDIVQTVMGGQFTPTFPTIRGGALTLIVSATVNGKTLTASTSGLVIQGTNPLRTAIRAALPNDTLGRIACQESGMRQFVTGVDGGVGRCPTWSADNLGGVGIMQITVPAPTDDQVWNWRSNLAAGIQELNQKVTTARQYPGQVRNSSGFRQMVTAFNLHRQQQGLPPLQRIDLPDFTSGDFNNNLQQLELDAIRGFNGWAGHDAFGFHLHEFRVAVDANGFLQVTVAPGATTGTAQWVRVPAADRPQNVGDPNYVAHVLSRSPTC
jgi:glycosyltransferase involved in cell wall biosynthesis